MTGTLTDTALLWGEGEVSLSFFPGWPGTLFFLSYTYQAAAITGMSLRACLNLNSTVLNV
jgi:hypothetical protein